MITGIGTDIVSVKRIENLLKAFDQKFLEKIYTKKEIGLAGQKGSQQDFLRKTLFLAKRFSAKEAFAKAIGLGIGRGVNFCDIEIINDKNGKPEIKLINQKDVFLKNHLSCIEYAIHLSLSDEREFAIATVIIEKIK
ncbi:MAG: holo-ACP synthase [Rickettsiales bacterium]|nr:holo-ACP synthase [Rickettsiales bacterium]